MEFFLPIAEVNVSLPFIFFLSLVVGILSGLFGVGGGFLMTPFLIFLGIPPAYAVPNEANNILGTSISGSTTHYLKGTLDYKMGLMIVVGGVVGTILGIFLIAIFNRSIKENAIFIAAIISEIIVLIAFFSDWVSFLWLNVIGALMTVFTAFIIQQIIKNKA